MKLFFTMEFTPQEAIELLEYIHKKEKERQDKSDKDFTDRMNNNEFTPPPIFNPKNPQ